MKIRNGVVALLVITSVGSVCLVGRSKQPGCDTIIGGDTEQSFVQRLGCAKQALKANNVSKAYELMAPIYSHATTGGKGITVGDSQNKLGDIAVMRLQRDGATDEVVRTLIEEYGAHAVYAAVVMEDHTNPNSGKKLGKQTEIADENLVQSVRSIMHPMKGRVVAAKPVAPTADEIVRQPGIQVETAREQRLEAAVERSKPMAPSRPAPKRPMPETAIEEREGFSVPGLGTQEQVSLVQQDTAVFVESKGGRVVPATKLTTGEITRQPGVQVEIAREQQLKAALERSKPTAPSRLAPTLIPQAPPLSPEAEKKRELSQKLPVVKQVQVPKEDESLRSGIMVYSRTLTIAQDTPAGKVEEVITPPCQGLIIALDDSEKWPTLGSATNTVHKALFHKIPCLVSASLLQNIFTHHLESKPTYKQYEEEAQREALSKEEYNLLINTIILDAFKPQEWIIRQIGESLILLLPAEMVKKAGQGEPTLDENVLTERELNLGLKIDHQKVLNDQSLRLFLSFYQKPMQQDYFMQVVWNPKKEEEALKETQSKQTDLLIAIEEAQTSQDKEKTRQTLADYMRTSTVIGGSAIFVTGAEYARLNAKQQQPQWTIVMFGHGAVGETIADLPIREFKAFLAFLDTKLITKLLIYNSCYAMGTNAQVAFQESEKIGRIYQFPIITVSTYDASSVTLPVYIISADDSLSLSFIYDFAKFFENIWSKNYRTEPYDSALMMLPLMPELLYAHYMHMFSPPFINEAEDVLLQTFMNYPYIRPAGRDYFISLFPGVEIGKAMTASRTAPLDVVAASRQKGVRWDRTYVLLRADPPKNEQIVSFPLVLRKYGQKFVPFIMSATAGNADHYISKIDSEYPIADVIAKMLSFEYTTLKSFLINEFVDRSNGGAEVYENVIVSQGHIDQPGGPYVSLAFMTAPSGKYLQYSYANNVLSGPEDVEDYYPSFSNQFAFALPHAKAQ